jgi:hypothetical protein
MFEAEVEMEKRSSILPLLLMVCLLAGIVGLAGYLIYQVRGKGPLQAQEANGIVTAALQGSGPATIRFHTGVVKTGDDGKPDVYYRLMEKAGLVKLGKPAKGNFAVSLTPDGEHMLDGVPGVKKSQEADGTFLYKAPLAQRQLVSIAGVNTNGDNAVIEYNWKWVSNPLGDVFDAGGPLVKSFGVWERQTLINKYGADFYHADPTKATMTVARNGKSWKISAAHASLE